MQNKWYNKWYHSWYCKRLHQITPDILWYIHSTSWKIHLKPIWYSKTDASIFKIHCSFFVWSLEDQFMQFIIELPSMVGGKFSPAASTWIGLRRRISPATARFRGLAKAEGVCCKGGTMSGIYESMLIFLLTIFDGHN